MNLSRSLRRLVGRLGALELPEAVLAVVAAVALGLVAMSGAQAIRTRAVIAGMTADFQRFALHQESIRRDRALYSADAAAVMARGLVLNPSARVRIHEATSGGWSATMSREDNAIRCYLFVGDAAPVGLAVTPGEVACV